MSLRNRLLMVAAVSGIAARMRVPLTKVIMSAAVAGFAVGGDARGQTSYTSTSSTAAWGTSRWNNSADAAPYNTAFTANNAVNFATGTYSFITGMGSGNTVNVGNVTLAANTTVTFSGSIAGTYATGGTVRTIDVGNGSLFDLSSQNISTAAGTGFIKAGSGVLAITGSAYLGGFTLNAGTIIVRGVNAMGNGALTLNGGTVASNASRDMSGKFTTITIGGNVQFGELSANVALANDTANLTFSDSVGLGSAIRTFTLGNQGTHTFSGIISGATGGGLNFSANAGTTGGSFVLSGANTYSGATTLSAGTLNINNGGSSSSNSAIGTGTLSISGGTIDNTSGSPITLATNNAQNWQGDFAFGGTNALNLGTGAVSITNGNRQITINGTGSLTIGGTITGVSGTGITKAGTGTLILNGSGTTTLPQGMVINTGIIQYGNNNSTSSGIQINSSGVASTAFAMDQTFVNKIINSSGGVAALAVNSSNNLNFSTSGLNAISLGATVASTYSGTLTPANATYQLGGGGATLTYQNALSGSNSLNVRGDVQLNTASTYSGTTTINAGTLTLINGGTNILPTTTAVSLANNATANLFINGNLQTIAALSGGGAIGGNLQLGGGTLAIGDGTSTTYSGILSGTSGAIVKQGAGSLTLTGANTYTGTTTISAGSLIAGAAVPSGSAGAFGNASSTITLGNSATTANGSSPSLLTGGAFTIGRTVTIANQSTTGTYTIGGNTDNNSTFSGLVTVNQPLTISQVATTASNALSITGGITGAGSGNKTVTFSGPGAITVSTTAISNGSGTLALNLNGGTLTLSSTNTFTGGFTLSSGTAIVSNNSSFGGATSALNISGGTIQSSGTRTFANNITIGGNAAHTGTGNATFSGTVDLGSVTRIITNNTTSGSRIFSGVISSTGTAGMSFAGTGAGQIYIGNPLNSFTGTITINGGEVGFSSDGSLGNTANTIVIDGGRLTSSTTAGAAVSSTWSSTHAIQVGSTAGTSISVQSSGGDLTYNGVIADFTTNGILVKQGAGILRLGGASTYGGGTSINNGTLQLTTGNDRLPTGTVVSLGQASSTNVGTFDLNGLNQQIAGLNNVTGTGTAANTVTSTAAATLTIGGSGTYSYGSASAANNGTITGTITLTKTGAGAQTLGQSNAYTGGTNINGGILAIGNASALGTTGTISFGGGTLQYSGINTDLSARFSNAANQAYSIDTNGSNVSVGTALTSSGGSLSKLGSGNLTLAAANTYTGSTAIQNGTIQLTTGNDRLPTGTVVSLGQASSTNVGTFDLNGRNQQIAGLNTVTGTGTAANTVTSTAGATLTIGGSGTYSYGSSNTNNNGTITGAITLTKTGVGTQTLGQSNAFTGGTNINGGILAIGNASALGTMGTISFGGGTMQYSGITTDLSARFSSAANQAYSINTNGNDVVFDSALTSSGGSLIKLGAASLTLSVANSYTGGTNINGGILAIANASSLGTTGTISFGGGTMQYSGITTDLSARFSSAAGQAYSINTNGNDVTFGSALTSSGGSLAKIGAGILTLSGSNTYSGVTSINSGVLSVGTIGDGGNPGSLGQATNAATNLVFGAPTATLRYTGDTSTTNRSFTLSSGAGGGATLDASGTGAITFDNTVALAYGTTDQTRLLTLTGTSTAANTFAKVIADNGTGLTGVTKSGVGTWVLNGTNTYTGITSINGGILVMGSAASLGSGTINFGGGTLQTFDGTDLSSRFGAGQPISINATTNVTFATSISASSFTKTGVGTTVTFGAASNTITGAINIVEGGLSFDSVAALGANTGITLGNLSALSFSGNTNQNLTSNITVGGSAGSNGFIVNTGTGQLELSGTLAKDGRILTFAGTGTNSFLVSGQITGSSANSDLVVSATTVTLSNSNSFNGPTFIRNDGTLNTNAAGALPTPTRTALTIDGTGTSTLNLIGGFSQEVASLTSALTSASVNLNSNSLTIGASTGSTDFAGVISGSAGSLIKDGASTQILSGTNTYTGSTTINAGSLFANNNAALATGAVSLGATSGSSNSSLLIGLDSTTLSNALTVNAGSSGVKTIGVSGTGVVGNYTGTIGLSDNVTLTSGGSATAIALFNGVISGTGNVTIAGSGVVEYHKANSYIGSTTIQSAATLRNHINDAIPTGSALTVNGTGTYDLGGFNQTVASLSGAGFVTNSVVGTSTLTTNQTSSTTFSGTISNGGTPLKITALNVAGGASNSLTLTGANTYTGGTTVGNGILLANTPVASGSATGTGDITVTSGGTLGGNGRAGAAGATTTVQSGSTITAGTDTANPSLTLNGAVTFAGGSTYRVNLFSETVASSINQTAGSATVNSGALLVLDVGAINRTTMLAAYTGTPFIYTILSSVSLSGGTNYNSSNVSLAGSGASSFFSGDWTSASTGNVVVLQFAPVPEPGTIILGTIVGLGGLGYRLRRRARSVESSAA